MPSRRLSSLRLSHRWCGRGSMFLCLRTSSYSYSSRTHPPSRGFWGSVSSRRLVDREGSCRPSSLSSNNSRVLRRHIHGAQKNSTKRRLIHNMMFLNRHYLQRPPKFRLVNVAQLRRVIQPLDYLVSYDLSDASGLSSSSSSLVSVATHVSVSHDASSLDPTVVFTMSSLHQSTDVISLASSLSLNAPFVD